jgi:hypothetical protein
MSRRLLAPLVLALAVPALAGAEERAPAPPTAQERLEEMFDRFFGRLDPSLDALGTWLGDLGGYHPPEILPNGDILIRRRAQPPAEPFMPEPFLPERSVPERPLPERSLPEPPAPRPPVPERAEPPVTEPFEL